MAACSARLERQRSAVAREAAVAVGDSYVTWLNSPLHANAYLRERAVQQNDRTHADGQAEAEAEMALASAGMELAHTRSCDRSHGPCSKDGT